MWSLRFILLFFGIFMRRQCSGHPIPDDEDFRLVDNSIMFDISKMSDEEIAREAGRRVADWTNSSDVNPEELGLYTEGDIVPSSKNSRNGLTDERTRWPKGIVPYEIAGYFSGQDRATIKKAMDEYHKKTCIRFVPRQSNHRDYISIVSGNTGCWSSVGRVGGAQQVNLQSPGCLSTVGTPMHELMHALGFLHEQNRYERDNHVTIMWNNIQSGRENNFEKAKKGQAHGQGIDYDYRSVMHYSAGAFSRNGQPTIVPKISGIEIGQRQGFSRGDIQKIRHMYKCGGDTSSGSGSDTDSSCLIPFLCLFD